MPLDLATGDYIRQLRRVGPRPSERLVQQILHAGPAAVEPLIALAQNVELLNDEPPQCYAPIHALRLLGELLPLRMIEPLLSQFPIPYDDPDNEVPGRWIEEAPQMIARIGAEAIESLWEFTDDPEEPLAGRNAALIALTFITGVAPEARDTVMDGLRERMAQTDDTAFRSYLAATLANLGVEEVYADVMALYRQGLIDQQILPPAIARQLLLSSGEPRIACVRHPLWERYDQHGPFPQEES